MVHHFCVYFTFNRKVGDNQGPILFTYEKYLEPFFLSYLSLSDLHSLYQIGQKRTIMQQSFPLYEGVCTQHKLLPSSPNKYETHNCKWSMLWSHILPSLGRCRAGLWAAWKNSWTWACMKTIRNPLWLISIPAPAYSIWLEIEPKLERKKHNWKKRCHWVGNELKKRGGNKTN